MNRKSEGKLENTLEKMKMKRQHTKPMRCSESNARGTFIVVSAYICKRKDQKSIT